jgi:hypothetical protein
MSLAGQVEPLMQHRGWPSASLVREPNSSTDSTAVEDGVLPEIDAAAARVTSPQAWHVGDVLPWVGSGPALTASHQPKREIHLPSGRD